MAGRYFERPKPRLYGHRGAAGVAPENTMESFRRAVADGAAYLELDVHASRDGVVTVIHDPTVDRTTDGTGTVRELSFEELRRFDAGYRFSDASGGYPWRGRGVRLPSLEELLRDLPGVPLNIEIKQADPPIEGAVVGLLERYGAVENVILAAEHHAIMKRIRVAAPQVATSASAEEVRDFFERLFAGTPSGGSPAFRALQIPPRFGDVELVTADTLRAAHDRGPEVHVWTINEPGEMKRLLDLGVDGIMSDFPAALVDVAHQKRTADER